MNNQTANLTQCRNNVETPLIITIFTYTDYVIRLSSMIIFCAYFKIVLAYKDLQKLGNLYVHHMNLVGFLFCLMYVFYFNTSLPTFSNPYVNQVLCTLFGACWLGQCSNT